MKEILKQFKFFPCGRKDENTVNFKAPKPGWKWQERKVTYDDALKESEFKSVGLPIPQGLTVLDIDEKNYAAAVMKILDNKKVKYAAMETEHGFHLWFKSSAPEHFNGGVKVNTMITIPVDSRVAGKNYVIVTINGKERVWVKDTPVNELDEIPFFLWFNYGKTGNTESSMFGMKEHDGRNSSLFDYLNRLQSIRAQHYPDMTDDEIIEIVNIINEYVFADPLSSDEIDQITRYGSLTNIDDVNDIVSAKKAGNEVIYDDYRNKIVEPYFVNVLPGEKPNINRALDELDANFGRTFIFGDHMYQYIDGYYKKISCAELKAEKLIESYIRKRTRNLSSRGVNEIVRQYIGEHNLDDVRLLNPDRDVLNMENGRYNTRTHEFTPHNPDILETVRIPVVYDPNITKNKEVDDFRKSLFEEDNPEWKKSVDLADEIMGYTFLRGLPADKGFLFFGSHGTGKSTYLRLMSAMVGNDNVSAVPMEVLSSPENNKFETSKIDGMLLNATEETSAKMISCKQSAVLKDIVCDSKFNVQAKFEDSRKVELYATQVHCINHPFMSADSAIWERVIILYFPTNYRSSKKKETSMDKVIAGKPENLSYLFNKAMDALKRLQKNKFNFSTSAVLKAAFTRFYKETPLENFVADIGFEVENLDEYPVKDLFDQYKVWAENNGEKPLGKTTFANQIDVVFGVCHRRDKTANHVNRFYLK